MSREKTKAVAEEICHLASLGGNLHPNDIIPDIEKLVSQAHNAGYEEALEKVKVGLPSKIGEINPDTGMPFYHPQNKGHRLGFNDALKEVRGLLTSLSKQTK